MTYTKKELKALSRANHPNAPKELLERRNQIETETQTYLDQNQLNARYDYWAKMAY